MSFVFVFPPRSPRAARAFSPTFPPKHKHAHFNRFFSVEHWADAPAFARCNRTDTDSTLYNAMINPYVV